MISNDVQSRPRLAHSCTAALFTLLAASAVTAGVAADWKAPSQFVGIGGARGTYEQVQNDLSHMGWQEIKTRKEKATLSLDDLLAGQMRWRDALRDVEVDFTYSVDRRHETARDKENQKHGRDLPAAFAFEARIAFKGEKRYTFLRDLTPHPLENGNLQKRPRLIRRIRRQPEFVYAFNGTLMRTLEPSRSVGHIHPAKLEAVDAQHMWYFDALSWPTGPRAQRQLESVWYVPTALKTASIYRVLPTIQDVDGAPCHVVTSGCDTLWIDPAHGFCIRRRVWFHMKKAAEPPVLGYVYANQNFRQFDQAIWLPQRCCRIDFAGPQEPNDTQGTLTAIHTVLAKSIDVNKVADAIFDLQFPPGTAVQDLVNNKSYVVPHGENLLEEAIAKANPIVNGIVKPIGLAAAPTSSWKRRWLIIGNVAAFCLLIARLWWRRSHPQATQE